MSWIVTIFLIVGFVLMFYAICVGVEMVDERFVISEHDANLYEKQLLAEKQE